MPLRRLLTRLGGGPLGSRNFRLLAGSITISMYGNGIAIVAQPFAIFAVGGTVAEVGFAAAASTVPLVVFLLVGGVVGDRFPRHLVLASANVVQGACQLVSGILVVAGVGGPWLLIALVAVRGCAFAFVLPAEQGLVPQTVRPDQLGAANAVQRLGIHAARIVGASSGGVLVGTVGAGWALVVDAATFGLAALARAGMRFPVPAPVARTHPLHELREGWREFRGRQWLWVIVLQSALVIAVHSGGINVLGPLVARESLGGAGPWGLVMASAAVGAFAGALVMLRWRPRRPLLVAAIAALFDPLPVLGLAVPLPVPYLAAAMFLSGASMGVFGVTWSTTMQQEIPPTLLSRVAAYDALGSFALAPVGAALAGPVALAAGTDATLVGGYVLVLAATAGALLSPQVRNLSRRTHP